MTFQPDVVQSKRSLSRNSYHSEQKPVEKTAKVRSSNQFFRAQQEYKSKVEQKVHSAQKKREKEEKSMHKKKFMEPKSKLMLPANEPKPKGQKLEKLYGGVLSNRKRSHNPFSNEVLSSSSKQPVDKKVVNLSMSTKSMECPPVEAGEEKSARNSR